MYRVCTKGSVDPHMSRLLAPLMTATLLIPYITMLAAFWMSESKHSAASGLAFAGALVVGWLEKGRLQAASPGHHLVALCGLAVATLAYVCSVILDFRVGVGFFAPSILISLLYMIRGRQGVLAMRLPIALLLLATPLPGFFMDRITYFLLDVLVVILPAILAVLQIPVAVDASSLVGNGWTVQVVEDCSGLGGILLFVPLSLLLLYSHPRVPPMGYALVLAASLPIAFSGTVLRILVDCVLGTMGSSLFSSDLFHLFVGLAVLLLGLCLLVTLCRLFSRTASIPGPRQQEALA